MAIMIKAHKNCTEKPIMKTEQMHSHNSYEIFYLLEGDTDYCVEGSRYHLMPGDIMIMRKGEVHIFQLRSASRYERMCVNFDIQDLLELTQSPQLLSMFHDRPLGKFNHYRADLFPGNHWQEYMERICSTKDTCKQLCYLLPLLHDLADGMETVRTAPAIADKDRAAPIIKYINSNLTDELSLDILSERFYISKAHLNRIFKQATGTTAWEYITIKRLFLAKEMIDAGTQPSDVYQQCGFRDYTTFFRSFKQHFGISPKECQLKSQ